MILPIHAEKTFDNVQHPFMIKALSKEEAESLNRPTTADEIEAIIKKLPTHKRSGPDSFTGEFSQCI